MADGHGMTRLFFHGMRRSALLAALAATTTSQFAVARNNPAPEKQEINLRESCRRAASGAYLDAWDSKLQTARMLDTVTTKLKKTEKALKTEQKALAELQKNLRDKGYDLELAQAVDSKSGMVRTLEGQILELKDVLGKTKAASSEAAKNEATRRKEIILVFDIKTVDKGGRPARLDYKAQCPKFRFLCPLPRDHALQLRENTALESCTRYAEQSLSNR